VWRPTALSIYSAVGFAIAAAVHFGTYIGTSIQPTNPLFFALHLGMFPAFGICVFRSQRWQGRRSLFRRSEPSRLGELRTYFPTWALGLAVACFSYTFVNFFLATGHLSSSHGGSLSAEEAMYTVRAFSGHWLVFYLLPTLYAGFVPADAYPAGQVPSGKAAV
jgi:hypothetical protein